VNENQRYRRVPRSVEKFVNELNRSMARVNGATEPVPFRVVAESNDLRARPGTDGALVIDAHDVAELQRMMVSSPARQWLAGLGDPGRPSRMHRQDRQAATIRVMTALAERAGDKAVEHGFGAVLADLAGRGVIPHVMAEELTPPVERKS